MKKSELKQMIREELLKEYSADKYTYQRLVDALYATKYVMQDRVHQYEDEYLTSPNSSVKAIAQKVKKLSQTAYKTINDAIKEAEKLKGALK